MNRLVSSVAVCSSAICLLTSSLSFAQDEAPFDDGAEADGEPVTAEGAPVEPPPPVAEARGAEVPARLGPHSVNVNPLGLMFGSYSVNYMHLFDGTHGVVGEGTYSSASDEFTETSFVGGGLGYRWHWSSRQNSWFLGVMGGYSVGAAKTETDGEDFKLDITTTSMIPNIGKRWAWDSGLNLTIRAGVGWAKHVVSTNLNTPEADAAVDTVNDFLEMFPVACDGEASLGWIF